MSIKTWQERAGVVSTRVGELGYEVAMQAEIDEIRSELVERKAEIERFNSHIHTCGPTCAKAGCINSRQSKELEQLTETSVWQAGRISELLDEIAAQRKVLEQALVALRLAIPHSTAEAQTQLAAITAIQEQLK